tara:strand:- start:641 stop:2455 length:1815 start_codon:yes stop_codon:yes gene_type:complete
MADQKFNIKIFAMDKTKKGFASAAAGIKRITQAVFSMRSALLLVGGAAGFGFLIKRSLATSDALVKTASKIGTTADSLAGLRYAAELTGVATNTMDMALQRFTRRTAEAAKGTGEAKSAIKELGIDAQALNRMPLDERMLVLSDAFGKVTNESDRLRLAFKLFDSEGAALVNTLSKGREGLKEMLGEAKLLGLGLSRDAAKGVERANDEFTKLNSLFVGLTRQVSAALAPAIAYLTDAFKTFLLTGIEVKGGMKEFAKSLAVDILSAVRVTIQGLEDLTNGIIGVFNDAIAAKNKFNNFFSLGKKDAAGYREELDNIKETQEKMINNASMTFDQKLPVMALLEERYKTTLALMQEAQDAEKEIGEVSFASGIVSGLDEAIAKLQNFQEVTDYVFPDLAEKVGTVHQSFNDWSAALPSTEENLKSLTNQALDGLTDSLAAGVTGAANFADAMKSMAKSVVDSLIKMLIQKYIVDAAFGAITASFGGGGTSVTGGTAASGGIGMGQGFSNTAAIGGPVFQGQSTLVGERGPEIFVPNASGSIIPNNKLGGGSGVTINQTINVTTGIQSTVRAEIVGLMPQIAQAAKGAVADARLRGGNFSKAMSGA